LGLLDIEVIVSMEIDMRVTRGPDLGEIAIQNGVAFFLELLDGGGHIHGVP
jgi:hypothetical protein